MFTKLGSYKGDGSFEGWARRIFVTTALMSLRKKDALKMSDELEAVRGMKTEITGQVENIGYKELMELVMSLPPGFRTVFNMYAVEGYSHKEIADILGISEVTSRSQFSRARALLEAPSRRSTANSRRRSLAIIPKAISSTAKASAQLMGWLVKVQVSYSWKPIVLVVLEYSSVVMDNS